MVPAPQGVWVCAIGLQFRKEADMKVTKLISFMIIAMALSVPASALDIVPTWDNGVHTWTAGEKAVVERAILEWEGAINMPGTVDIGFGWENAGGAYAGITYLWTYGSPPAGDDLYPWSPIVGHFVAFNLDIGWYVDPDPATDEAFGGYDLLHVARHELAHALGQQVGIWYDDIWISHVDRWDSQIVGNVFDPGGLNVSMPAGDHGHTNDFAELMYPTVYGGVRRDVTETIRAMFNKAHGYDMYPDFNKDLLINATDLAVLAANFGTFPRGWSDGDADFDTVINATDLAILANEFGFDGTAGAAVPEPVTLLILGAGAVGVLRRRLRA